MTGSVLTTGPQKWPLTRYEKGAWQLPFLILHFQHQPKSTGRPNLQAAYRGVVGHVLTVKEILAVKR